MSSRIFKAVCKNIFLLHYSHHTAKIKHRQLKKSLSALSQEDRWMVAGVSEFCTQRAAENALMVLEAHSPAVYSRHRSTFGLNAQR